MAGDYTEKGQAPDTAPLVWAVASYRAGENSQITGLANRLGAQVVVKRLEHNAKAGPVGLARRVSLAGINLGTSDALRPPWPDLVVSAGVKNEPVCRWIRRASDGCTRLVFLGRTWAARRHFDLVVTTPQYRLPAEDNVIHNLMTQHGVDAARLAAEQERWEPQFASLPRPVLGVLIGGDSGPFVLGERAARRLARQINAMVEIRRGSAIVSTSARTRPIVADVLERELTVPAHVHRYRRDDPDNPYFGVLALANALLVTSDSIAMLSEAAATDRPVHIFDLAAESVEGRDRTLKSVSYRAMMNCLPTRLSRDLGLFHEAFVAAGHGSWSAERYTPTAPSAGREIDSTVARVRSLLQ